MTDILDRLDAFIGEYGYAPDCCVPDARDEIKRLRAKTPKVKALEWGALSTPEWDANGIAVRIAKTGLGEYRIRSIPLESQHIWTNPFGSGGVHLRYDEAKAAAQADYERRILEALMPLPDPEDE